MRTGIGAGRWCRPREALLAPASGSAPPERRLSGEVVTPHPHDGGMSKQRTVFRCGECGGASPKWVGRCPSCGEWNTLRESATPVGASARIAPIEPAVRVVDVDMEEWKARPTGIDDALRRVVRREFLPLWAADGAKENRIGLLAEFQR